MSGRTTRSSPAIRVTGSPSLGHEALVRCGGYESTPIPTSAGRRTLPFATTEDDWCQP